MPSRNWKFRIQDILDSIAAVKGYVADMTFDQFVHDQRTIYTVVRRFTIIGEASNHVPDGICSIYQHIPWLEMRDMRNLVVHEYFGVSEKILWDTIHDDLPAIVEPLQHLLAREIG